MALTTIQKLRFLVRGGVAAAVAALNEIPLARELIFETDKGRAKLGDGTTHYNDIDTYVGWGRADLSTLNDGQVMQYDGTLGYFVPVDMSGGSGSSLDPTAVMYLYEDFMRGVTSSANSATNFIFTSALPVAYTGGSTGGSLGTQTGFTAGHPGVVDLSTGTGTSAVWRLYPWSGPNFILGGGTVTIRWSVMIGQASDATNRFSIDIGMRDGITGSGTNALMLNYSDNINSGNWRIYTLVAGTQANTDSAVPVVTGSWLNIELVVNAAANSATFKVNGTTIGTVTTGIPTGGQGVTVGIGKTAGSTPRHLYVDFVEMACEFTTPR